MKKIIILELHGFQVSNSMKINYVNGADLFIYPKEFFSKILYIKNTIHELNTRSVQGNTIRFPNLLRFDVGNDKYSYLICELLIDFYTEETVIIQQILDFMDVFLKLNTFLFDFFISISKIFLFKKEVSKFKLIRVIEQNIRINRNKIDILSYKYEEYCRDLSAIFRRISESDFLKNLTRMFYEYAAASDTTVLEVRFSLLWNFLEHMVNLYASTINRNFIINHSVFLRIKEQISNLIVETLESNISIPLNLETFNSELGRLLNQLYTDVSLPMTEQSWRILKNQIREKVNNLLHNDEILIEGYDKEKISDILIQQINVFPPIKELIKLVLKDVKYVVNSYEKLTLEIVYEARNHFYHRTTELIDLFQIIISKYEDITHFNVDSLRAEIKNFNKFLRRIISHFFHNRRFGNLQTASSSHYFWDQHTITGESNANEYFINSIKTVEEIYRQEKKYAQLLKFILRKKDNYDNAFKGKNELNGICFYVENPEYITFQMNFENRFQAQGTFQGEIGYPRIYKFFINLNKELHGFSSILKFKEIINMSPSSNIHNIYIRILDYWSNHTKAVEENDYLLDNFI